MTGQGYLLGKVAVGSDSQRYSERDVLWLTVLGQPGMVRVTVTVRDTLTGGEPLADHPGTTRDGPSYSDCSNMGGLWLTCSGTTGDCQGYYDSHGGPLTVRACTRHPARELINLLSITLGRGSELLIAAMRDSATINSVALRTLSLVYPSLVDVAHSGSCW